ncbi:MAG TPA: YceI family protein [Hanamia sp.]
MKKCLMGMLFLLYAFPALTQIYICRNAEVTFFSSAPIEDIKGESSTALSALNVDSKEVYFKVPIRSFNFHSSLMQEHFNEDYLESDKFPYAEFKGKIIDNIDLTKPGTYMVTVEGNLTIHNVTKTYATKGSVEVKPDSITTHAVFNIKPEDHGVKIPTLLTKNLAENLQVTVDATYHPRPVASK